MRQASQNRADRRHRGCLRGGRMVLLYHGIQNRLLASSRAARQLRRHCSRHKPDLWVSFFDQIPFWVHIIYVVHPQPRNSGVS